MKGSVLLSHMCSMSLMTYSRKGHKMTKPTAERIQEVLDECEELDLSDGAYWMLVHEKLNLEYGDVFPMLEEYKMFIDQDTDDTGDVQLNDEQVRGTHVHAGNAGDYAGLVKRLRAHTEKNEVAGSVWWETPEVCEEAAAAVAVLEARVKTMDEAMEKAERAMTKDSFCETERLEEGLRIIRRARAAKEGEWDGTR
jgi:hypothetical protein